MKYEIPVTRTQNPKPRPQDESQLGFARFFTDHMFVMEYDVGKGWHSWRIEPHAPFLIEPASAVLHYAQMMFEGMKAYRKPDGSIQLFRPDMNIARMRGTCERMCMPEVPGDLFLEALEKLIEVDKDWIPHGKNTSLYIRPFLFGAACSALQVHDHPQPHRLLLRSQRRRPHHHPYLCAG